MLPASTNGGGICNNLVPDVCQTPSPGGPVPVPYPNVAMCNLAVKTALKVMFSGRPVVHKMSEIPLSSGDEAGTAGGVKSGTFIDKMTYMTGSTKVLIEGQQCEYHAAPTLHNGTNFNINGTQTAPSQVNVMVAP